MYRMLCYGLCNQVRRLLKDKRGQAMSEYGIIIAVISVALIVALMTLREQLVTAFKAITDKLAELE